MVENGTAVKQQMGKTLYSKSVFPVSFSPVHHVDLAAVCFQKKS